MDGAVERNISVSLWRQQQLGSNLTIHLRGLCTNPFLWGESLPLASQVNWGWKNNFLAGLEESIQVYPWHASSTSQIIMASNGNCPMHPTSHASVQRLFSVPLTSLHVCSCKMAENISICLPIRKFTDKVSIEYTLNGEETIIFRGCKSAHFTAKYAPQRIKIPPKGQSCNP